MEPDTELHRRLRSRLSLQKSNPITTSITVEAVGTE